MGAVLRRPGTPSGRGRGRGGGRAGKLPPSLHSGVGRRQAAGSVGRWAGARGLPTLSGPLLALSFIVFIPTRASSGEGFPPAVLPKAGLALVVAHELTLIIPVTAHGSETGQAELPVSACRLMALPGCLPAPALSLPGPLLAAPALPSVEDEAVLQGAAPSRLPSPLPS